MLGRVPPAYPQLIFASFLFLKRSSWRFKAPEVHLLVRQAAAARLKGRCSRPAPQVRKATGLGDEGDCLPTEPGGQRQIHRGHASEDHGER